MIIIWELSTRRHLILFVSTHLVLADHFLDFHSQNSLDSDEYENVHFWSFALQFWVNGFRSQKAKKGVKGWPPTGTPLTGIFCIFLCHWELGPPTAGTPLHAVFFLFLHKKHKFENVILLRAITKQNSFELLVLLEGKYQILTKFAYSSIIIKIL